MDKHGRVQTSRRSIENTVQEFYTELYRSSTTVPRCPLISAEEVPSILESEVAYAIKKMKKGTAPGPDSISTDLLLAGDSALYSLLAEHFNHYISLQKIPDWWKESKTILLLKKGQREDIANYRPISLLSVVYKIFTKILVNRMERILDDYQPVEQAGFRKNFSCLDHIQTVSQLIERSREYHLPLVLAFVDYRKAFDSVETNAVLNALTCAGVPSACIHLLDECFSNTSTTIQLFDRKLKVCIEKGVRQGDTISPKLFTAALENVMASLHWEDKGYLIDGKRISNLRFVDDIVLISSNITEMEIMINELNVAGTKIGLEMNMEKTKIMVNQWCEQGAVKLLGITIQQVDSYVYLGREMNMANDLTNEISRRRRASWAAFNSIREVTDQLRDADLKASIFNASVLPALCYATETWPDKKAVSRVDPPCAGKTLFEDKPVSATATQVTKRGSKGEVAFKRPVAVHERDETSLGRPLTQKKGRPMEFASDRMASAEQEEATGKTAVKVGRRIHNIIQRTRSATLDASRQESSGMAKLWSTLGQHQPKDHQRIKVK